MFKDKFKEANDSIHADEELINKVLALKNPENRIIIFNRMGGDKKDSSFGG